MADQLSSLPVRSSTSRPTPQANLSPEGRVPLRDNTRLLLFGVGTLALALGVLLVIAGRSTTLSPDFLSGFVLYALTATNVAMLAALSFVLARNIIKLVVEQKRSLPFARFRAKLVAALLGMTLIPAVLVLIVGSELIRNSVDRWFNAPMDEVLSSANAIAGDYYQERQRLVSLEANRLARELASINLNLAQHETIKSLIPSTQLQEGMTIEVYRLVQKIAGEPETASTLEIVEAINPLVGLENFRTSNNLLAEKVIAESSDSQIIQPVAEGELMQVAVPIQVSPDTPILGVVIASNYLTGHFAGRARHMTEAYEDYQQLRVFKQPLAGVYLSLFLMLTLLILVAATWMGLYLAKRITRPVQMLAVAAKEIGAGNLDHRVVLETSDEFGSLVDAFNVMAGKLAGSQRQLIKTASEVERKNREVQDQQRSVETILIRAQRATEWQEVARRLAHEIKNPLTPIQLCTERLRRHFSDSKEETRRLVDECASTIVGEVESLKGLVAEFSQFARMPAPKVSKTDLNQLLNETLLLYEGLFESVNFNKNFLNELPNVMVDKKQIRRVVINLIDNAAEAMDRSGTIDITTDHDARKNLVNILVADNGPGIPASEREKLFLPYYSTKLRGSGLGLAIVNRIVMDHGGRINVSNNEPRGTKFLVELPL